MSIPSATLPPAEPLPGDQEWISVYTGSGPTLSLIQAELESQGMTVVRMPTEVGSGPEVGVFGTTESAVYSLNVPADQYSARAEEIGTVLDALAGGDDAANLSAQAEAEQDYDVRGCPSCARFFHDTYVTCPGDDSELVPAVDCFVEGQLEPDLVVVAHGEPPNGADPMKARLEAAGLHPRAEQPAAWPVVIVALPWAELIDQTEAVEAALRIDGE
jgi:hypothetical protein